ncbi:hypothetical protein BRADI_4g42450v3 [Brachypodium distachyon]|uniref:DUF7866 domain-containing protein n=1 Tax=Brachypodium distachyon TaxID=15368 RepID=I1IUB7_BRADI|nr:hypothetical protein BRADI_4g42450v3 [Brachypodium distachyon]
MAFVHLAGLALLLLLQVAAQGGAMATDVSGEYVPVPRVAYRNLSSSLMAGSTPFETCKDCKCCQPPAPGVSSNKFNTTGQTCVNTKCCYKINCNLPGKPFGTCAFTPIKCGCSSDNDCPAKQSSSLKLQELT